jgi:hypothetical protein
MMYVNVSLLDKAARTKKKMQQKNMFSKTKAQLRGGENKKMHRETKIENTSHPQIPAQRCQKTLTGKFHCSEYE